MVSLKLVSLSGFGDVALNAQEVGFFGPQATAGATGFGLPPVSVQYAEGAGWGGIYRGTRVQMRDVDIPVNLYAPDRVALRAQFDTLMKIVTGRCRLEFHEDDGRMWFLLVDRVGGGDYSYGTATNGSTTLSTVFTFRAEDPLWSAGEVTQLTVTGADPTARPFLERFGQLPVRTDRTVGQLTLENTGTAPAFPTWIVHGPCGGFYAEREDGLSFRWQGSLGAGEELTIDAAKATVVDSAGENRYPELDYHPRFWQVPVGVSLAVVTLQDPSDESWVKVRWRARRWAVL